jgi:HEPN domain-containing protein
MDKRAEYWLSLADYDIVTARAMLQTGRYLYVGFMCHQTIEKSLKAIIALGCEEGQIPPKIHDLSKLAIRAGVLEEMTEQQQDFIENLNPMNIEARYPEYKERLASMLSKELCMTLITETEEMLLWIKARL